LRRAIQPRALPSLRRRAVTHYSCNIQIFWVLSRPRLTALHAGPYSRFANR
jgi:hypothetical protein